MSEVDLELMRKAEQALAEIDRTQGLIDRHADVLAALRIRLEGGPRKSLDELIEAAGTIEGRRGGQLDERLQEAESKPKGKLDDLLSAPERKKGSLDDLLISEPKPKDWPGS